MALLAPLFLAALAALAIPVVLHLSQRARKEPVRFPSLAFVRRVPFRTTERRRLRDRLLLLLRLAALALVVFAFTRPLLERGPLSGGGVSAAREVVILLDRSASMAYGDHWDRARDAVRRVARGLGPDDRATLVLFAGSAEVTGPPTGDPVQLEAYLAGARPDGGATHYGPAIDVARDLVEQATLPRKGVVLITDFQRVGWDGRVDRRLPAGTALEAVAVGEDDEANLAVTGVTLERTPADGGRVTVTARVANLSGRDARVQAQLGTESQLLHQTEARVAAGQVTLVRFPAIPLPLTPTPAWVRIDEDRLPADDINRFVLRPIPKIAVLVVEPSGASDRDVLYLRRALAIGQDPVFVATSRTAPSVADVHAADVVVLNDAPFPSGEAGRALSRGVESGRGLLWVMGPHAGGVPQALRAALGSVSGTPVDRLTARGGAMGIADYGHPMFAPYRDARGGDYGAVRVYRYRRLVAPDSGRVLAWMDDGSPILIESRLGQGRVLVWGSDFGNTWNDLPVRGVFLPTVHEAVRYLWGRREPPASYAVGQALNVGELDPPAATELVLEAPDGVRTPVPADTHDPIPLSSAGFYTLRPLAGGTGVPIAANLDPVESDLTPLDRTAFLEATSGVGKGETSAASSSGLTQTERERRQRLWWYAVLAALVVLAAESLFAGVRTRGVGA
jgi:von Willebrand factor type A domain/Aerotolerance regulator N-terminal